MMWEAIEVSRFRFVCDDGDAGVSTETLRSRCHAMENHTTTISPRAVGRISKKRTKVTDTAPAICEMRAPSEARSVLAA